MLITWTKQKQLKLIRPDNMTISLIRIFGSHICLGSISIHCDYLNNVGLMMWQIYFTNFRHKPLAQTFTYFAQILISFQNN